MVKKKIAPKLRKTALRTPTTGDDVKSALLLVSLVINAVVLIGWITLQVTSKYDEQVSQFLFG
jgi:hypothetical protein